jgi:hypothetical protein
MNVEIGAEAALFPEKEDVNGTAVAVWITGRGGYQRDGLLSWGDGWLPREWMATRGMGGYYTVSWRIRIFNCIEEVPRFFFSI